jgi:sugar (pentulose or hexulose) kinase
LWNQIQADIMGLPVVTSSVEEPECLGAAVILAVGLGIYKTAPEAISSMVRVEKRYEPRMGLKDVYDRNFEIYEGLCHSLAGSFQQQGS